MSIEMIGIVADVATALTMIFAVISFLRDVKVRKENKKHDKKLATLDAYSRLQTEALDAIYTDYTPSLVKEIINNNRSEEYKKLSTLVARIEHFCVGVNNDIYDEETVYQLAHGFLDKAIKARISSLIDKKNRNGKEDYYENVHKLYKLMEYREKSGE